MKVHVGSLLVESLVLILGALFYPGQAFSEVYSASDCYFRVVKLSETSFSYSVGGVPPDALARMARGAARMEWGGSPHFLELGHALDYAGTNPHKSRLLVTCGGGAEFAELAVADQTFNNQRLLFGTGWREYFLKQGTIDTEGANKNAWLLDLEKVIEPLREAKSTRHRTLTLDDNHSLQVKVPLHGYHRHQGEGSSDPLKHLFWFEKDKPESYNKYIEYQDGDSARCLKAWKSYREHLSFIPQGHVPAPIAIGEEPEDLNGMVSYVARVGHFDWADWLERQKGKIPTDGSVSKPRSKKEEEGLLRKVLMKFSVLRRDCAPRFVVDQVQNLNSVQMDVSPCPSAQETAPSAKRSRPETEVELGAPPSTRMKRAEDRYR